MQRLVRLLRDRSPFLVGITGSVAVGKSHLADALAHELGAAVVPTDSFLFPNGVLNERGLLLRKGFPETFDVDALDAFVAAARSGDELTLPIYDHATFDIVDGERRSLGRPELVILEGVLLPDGLDLTIYLDAEVADIERWFTDRFVEQVELARREPGGFYDLFAAMSDGEVREAAGWTWREINLPNLVEHIEPARATADIVVTKGPEHEVDSVKDQPRRAP